MNPGKHAEVPFGHRGYRVDFLVSCKEPVWLDNWTIHTPVSHFPSIAAPRSLQHSYFPFPVMRKRSQINSCTKARYLISTGFHLCWPRLANDDHVPSLFSGLFVCFGNSEVFKWPSTKYNEVTYHGSLAFEETYF